MSLFARSVLALPAPSRQGTLRWARPGEFTLRAFLNGKIDLAQAESVAQLISASGDDEARASQRGLRGELGGRFRALRAALIECLALVEASLDFPDEDLPSIAPELLAGRIARVLEEAQGLRSSTALRLPHPGTLRVVLCGFPNAGKSSLLNSVLGRPLALVSAVAGTTRDPVRGIRYEGGRRVEWIDVAGAVDIVGWKFGGEAPGEEPIWEAVRKLTRCEVQSADILVWVADASDEIAPSLRALGELEAPRKLLVLQKSDLVSREHRAHLEARLPDAVWVSAKEGEGISDLRTRVVEWARREPSPASRPGRDAPEFLVSAHQELALEKLVELLSRARESILSALGPECAAADLREAEESLDDVLGAGPRERVFDWIFSRFCIGK